MADPGFAKLVCTKCGCEPPAPAPACPRCQGLLAKVCGHCSARNAPAKNYCDHCGTPLSLPSGPGQAAPAVPATEVRRAGPGRAPHILPPPPGLAIPSAGRVGAGAPAPVPEGVFVPPPPSTEVSLTRLRRRDRRQSLYFWGPIAALLSAASFLYYDYHLPQNEIPRIATQYLDALSRGDVSRAYSLLSRDSQTHCSLEEFQAGREETSWTWSGLRLARVEPEAAVVEYRLQVAGQPPKDDFLMFLRDDGRWTRPYNWNLLKRAEEAFQRNDPDMALILAQEAVRIDPRDPMARGYLCEAVYYRKVPEQTEKECAAALQLSAAYPSKLSLKSLYHLHAILGDTYKNALRKYPEALTQYDAMLAFPGLTPADRCDLLLARADTRQALGQAAEAAEDLRGAAEACTRSGDLDFIHKRLGSGAAEVKRP